MPTIASLLYKLNEGANKAYIIALILLNRYLHWAWEWIIVTQVSGDYEGFLVHYAGMSSGGRGVDARYWCVRQLL